MVETVFSSLSRRHLGSIPRHLKTCRSKGKGHAVT